MDAIANFDALVAAADAPIYVVTVATESERAGCVVGFASQVGIEPRRFLVCLSELNYTYRVAAGATHVAVHLVDSGSRALAQLFGAETGDDVDKFTWCRWHHGPDGVVVLDEAAAWFSGRILERHDFGDHVGLLLEPLGGPTPPVGITGLRYSDLAGLTPGHPA
ncbi:flavin reductase family protein [Nocardia nova]|jgi:flavin reductase (DIM6/NTAB) family NADH-FMN oxidoreductase RutF|uniref:flavin reductase family protein n=1 Tax=Nocardia nova TaxID=37330 RepID=UPI0018939CCA|nr:flavin reductase family protein [Nocardia nova]MBF6147094.1 flavin reductase [Nocardia nova]